jgi:tetratricopeptide (TPR) repeat protein
MFMNTQVAEYLQLLKRRVVTANDAASKAEAQIDLAICRLRLGEVDLAAAMVQEVFSLSQSLEVSERLRVAVVAMFGKGVIQTYQGRFADAVGQLLDTIEEARIARMPHIRARSLAVLAVACSQLGAHRDGLEYGLAGLDAGTDANDLRAIVMARIAIANLHSEHEKPDIAIRYLQEVGEQAALLGDPFALCAVKGSLASASCNLVTMLAEKAENNLASREAFSRELHDAKERAEDGLEYSRAIGHVFFELSVLGSLSELYFVEGNTDEAIALISRVYEMSIKLDSLNSAAYALTLWGTYNLKIGRVGEALGRFQEGLVFAKQSGLLSYEAKIQQKLSECYEKQGRLLDALNALRSYARCIELQRMSELDNLVALTDAKRDFLSARSRGRWLDDEDCDGGS